MAARALGCSAVICMPTNSPEIKINAVRELGGTVELVGESFYEAQIQAQVGRVGQGRWVGARQGGTGGYPQAGGWASGMRDDVCCAGKHCGPANCCAAQRAHAWRGCCAAVAPSNWLASACAV